MLKKNFFGQTKHCKKCTLFSIAISNASQFYFKFTILMRAEVQGLSLKNCVWDFSFLIPLCFY